ncbi:hypothetical protein NIES4071_18290 [Calothrix sp. NIES-4071]|nr:hypothetical protein NIES4071_18290 [Calothrix sp. NIES-4071]BAZ56162.1 hypothetical protein NIES4105_18240 [Calothrix sp. NIES-4105]
MNGKVYILISAAIFAFMAVLHLIRLVNHWSVNVGAITVPFWGSWLALVIAVALSIWAFRLVAELSGSHQ